MMQHIRIEEEQAFRRFFGKRLLLARKAANLSQKGLAYYLRTGQDTISNYERGKVIPSMLTLYHIAEILAVNVSYFFPDERFRNLPEEDQETLALIPSLSPAACEFILGFIHAISQDMKIGQFKNPKLKPTIFLERYSNGYKYSLENKNNSSNIVLGLIVLLFNGLLIPETIPSKNRALFYSLIKDQNLLSSIVAELCTVIKAT